MRRLAPAFAGFWLAVLAPVASHADNTGRPMVFSAASAQDGAVLLFGDGDFASTTPSDLRRFLDRLRPPEGAVLFLNSAGGDLAAGMEVGQIARDARLATSVGQPPLVGGARPGLEDFRTGYCISACSFAFLGGVERTVPDGSVYAVHQVSMNCSDPRGAYRRFPWVRLPTVNYCPDFREAMAIAQNASGAVVEYVLSMGVDPLFLSEMAKADPEAINRLSADRLEAYRITQSPQKTDWSYETDEEGEFFLRATQATSWREHRVEFYCDRSSEPRLVMWVLHDARTRTGRTDVTPFTTRPAALTIHWEGRDAEGGAVADRLTLEPFEVLAGPSLSEHGNLQATIDVSQRLRDPVSAADIIDVSLGVEGSSDPPLTLIRIELDRAKLGGIARSCR